MADCVQFPFYPSSMPYKTHPRPLPLPQQITVNVLTAEKQKERENRSSPIPSSKIYQQVVILGRILQKMAASSEILRSSFLQQTSLLPSWNSPLFRRDEQSRLSFTPPTKQRRRRRSCRAVQPPVAAVVLKERFVKIEREETAVKFKVRAAVTVRRKKEDLGGAIANQVDALCDKLGRSVLLELVSTEIDPGRPPISLLQ